MSEKKDKRSLEENFDYLETNLKKMEDDSLPLDEAFKGMQ